MRFNLFKILPSKRPRLEKTVLNRKIFGSLPVLSGFFILSKLVSLYLKIKELGDLKKDLYKIKSGAFISPPAFNKRGQIIIEYVLLLLVSAVIAKLFVGLLSVDPAKNTPIFRYWEHLLRAIGEDIST